MIRKLVRSRGARKFVRSRMAMGAMGVIAAYVLLAMWIAGTNTIHDLGRWQGTWSLDNRPILGLFLRERTADRVGAPHLPGFGLRSRPDLRAEHYNYMITVVATPTFLQISKLDPQDGSSAEDLLRAPAFGERGFADLPLEDLRSIYDQIVQASVSSEAITFRMGLVEAVGRAIDDVERAREMLTAGDEGERDTLLRLVAKSQLPLEEVNRALGSDDPSELQSLLKEELSLTLEDLSLKLEEYQNGIGGQYDDGLALADAMGVFDAADLVFEAEGDILVAYDHGGLIEPLRIAADDLLGVLPKGITSEIDRTGELLRELFPMPSGLDGLVYRFKLMLGTDRQGRSILIRSLYGSKIAMQVGFTVGLISVVFGSLLGAAAAFFGGRVDHAVNWLFSLFTSIPSLVLLVVLAFMFTDSPVAGTLIPLYVSFCVTYWIGPCRVVRGETMKIIELEYIQAATAMGYGRFGILLKHIIPNTLHLAFINFSLLFVGAIKGEVILTYLGLGVKAPTPSWGIMISQSRSEVPTDFFWQIGSATFFMFVLVLAFNIVSDALQDAFDPKHQG